MQQMLRTAKGPIFAKITVDGSRSITYRAILLAALSDGVSEITDMAINADTHIFINALCQLGIVIQLDETARSCIIAGCTGQFPKKQGTLWCGESSVITKFLLAACSATHGVYYFDGSPQLREKSLRKFLNAIARQGVQFIPSDIKKMPFALVGVDTLEGGEMMLDSSATGQIMSAMLMIAPYARSPFIFTALDLENHPYVDMTCNIMAEFGVLVHRVHHGQFMVPVPQRYHARDYVVEPDFAFATYFFAAAAVTGGEVTIQPTKRAHSMQADIRFLSVLEKMGCEVIEGNKGLTVKGPNILQGIEVSMREFKDAFLALVSIAPFANAPTRIMHINAMDSHEIKRLTGIKTELGKLGIVVETEKDSIKILPGKPVANKVTSHDDHRIAMALAIIGLKVPGIVLDHTDCINKMYPSFFKEWHKLVEPVNIGAE